jgi:putative methyltransferase (TIGR04325 family)
LAFLPQAISKENDAVSLKDVAIETLASQPFRGVLVRLEGLPYGKRILNELSLQRGVYETFEEAWSVARRKGTAGHEHPDNVRNHLRLSQSLRASDYAVLYWLSGIAAKDGFLKIFDFGGSAGNLYYSYSRYLRDLGSTLLWTVFDLPGNIEEGLRIKAERNATALQFTNSCADAIDSNVVLISGALHYWEGSIAAFVEQFPNRPAHIIVNRTPVCGDQPSYITVQQTRSFSVPCLVRKAEEVVSGFVTAGYEMVDRWPALELRLRMWLYPARTVSHYSGFYFRRLERDSARSEEVFS